MDAHPFANWFLYRLRQTFCCLPMQKGCLAVWSHQNYKTRGLISEGLASIANIERWKAELTIFWQQSSYSLPTHQLSQEKQTQKLPFVLIGIVTRQEWKLVDLCHPCGRALYLLRHWSLLRLEKTCFFLQSIERGPQTNEGKLILIKSRPAKCWLGPLQVLYYLLSCGPRKEHLMAFVQLAEVSSRAVLL